MLNALPVFEEAAHQRSFTLAADTLGMAQPSVSRFISNLEEHLGVELFNRQHNKVSLTAEGEQLFEATKLGLGHIRMAIENLDASVSANILTVLCSQGFAHQWFLPRRNSLMTHLQGYEIHLSTTETLADHVPRDSDIEVLFGRGEWEGKESHLLFDEVVFAVCSPGFASHHNLAGENLDPGAIPKQSLLVQDRGEMGWMDWVRWLGHFGEAYEIPKAQYAFNNYALTLQAAMEGKGIALAWDGLANSHLANNWLVELDGLRFRTGQGYYLTFSPNNPVAPGLRNWAAKVGQSVAHSL